MSIAVRVGCLTVGGGAPVTVQSMTNTSTSDREATLRQARELQAAGCDILRITVPTVADAAIFDYLHSNGIKMPLVADIHFDYKIAIECAAAGADKLRINPGNIGSPDRVRAVAASCRAAGIPIRVGVNGGSLRRDLLAKYGSPTAEALAESALDEARELERCDFDNIIIAVKSSDPRVTVKATRIVASQSEHPLHLGVTEAGSEELGLVRGAAAIGSLLLDGIGDTLRVSLTADPLREVIAGRRILRALGLDPRPQVRVVSCPTCGRTRVGLIDYVNRFEREAAEIAVSRTVTVAIMGCAVNGPGEAREADVGVACGDGDALLFRRGETIGKIRADEIVPRLIDEARRIGNEK